MNEKKLKEFSDSVLKDLEKIWPTVRIYIKVDTEEQPGRALLHEFSCKIEGDPEIYTGLGGWYLYHTKSKIEYKMYINDLLVEPKEVYDKWIQIFTDWHLNIKKNHERT